MKKKLLLFFSYIILLLVYLLFVNKFHISFQCPIYKLTKLHCPGCGITRMLIAILHGNFYQAFRFNPLLFIMLPIFILYYIFNYISILRNKTFFLAKYESKICTLLLISFLTYGVLRNIPLFSFLEPTII